MNIKTDKKLLEEAIAQGCTTAAELARYLKVREMATRSFRQA